MDSMEVFHIFATRVADSLNKGDVKPLQGFMCSLVSVTSRKLPNGRPGFPMGGSINFDEKTQQWYVTAEMAEIKKEEI